MAARPDPFPSGILPVGMTARQHDSASEELADSISIPTLVRAVVPWIPEVFSLASGEERQSE